MLKKSQILSIRLSICKEKCHLLYIKNSGTPLTRCLIHLERCSPRYYGNGTGCSTAEFNMCRHKQCTLFSVRLHTFLCIKHYKDIEILGKTIASPYKNKSLTNFRRLFSLTIYKPSRVYFKRGCVLSFLEGLSLCVIS